MDDKTTRTTKVLSVLVAFLVAVAAFEGYYLFRVHQRVESATVNAQATDTVTCVKPDNGWKLGPALPSPKSSASLNSPLSAWFGRNSQWDPAKEMQEMQKRMDRMFSQTFGQMGVGPAFSNFMQEPAATQDMTLSDEPGQYVVRVTAPGMDGSKINASLEDQTLTVSGAQDYTSSPATQGVSSAAQKATIHWERSMTLPGPVKESGMAMKVDKGVLTITIPKDTSKGPSPLNIQ